MAAPPVAPRSRTPRAAPSDDALYARALEFSEWGRRNIRWIVIAAVVAAVIIGGLLYYRAYQVNRLERAASAFVQLEQSVAAGNAAVAAQDLQLFAQRYDGTPYADEARLLLARIRLQTGEPQAAAEAIQPVADELGSSPMGAQAALLLGAAQAQAGQLTEAVETYLRVAEESRFTFEQQEALLSAAAIREQAGDFAGAAELYRRALDAEAEGTLQRSLLEMRLGEAEARAQAG